MKCPRCGGEFNFENILYIVNKDNMVVGDILPCKCGYSVIRIYGDKGFKVKTVKLNLRG